MSMWLGLKYGDSLEHGLFYLQEIECAVIVSATWRNRHEQLSPHCPKLLKWILLFNPPAERRSS